MSHTQRRRLLAAVLHAIPPSYLLLMTKRDVRFAATHTLNPQILHAENVGCQIGVRYDDLRRKRFVVAVARTIEVGLQRNAVIGRRDGLEWFGGRAGALERRAG